MNSSELHRKLLFCGYSDITDYFKHSQVNRYIYKQMLRLLPTHQIDIPVLTLLNEIYYQCVRVQYDGKPGEALSRRYLDEEEAWLGRDSGHANMLVFCYVYVLIIRKLRHPFEEECFLKQIYPLIEGCEFMPAANELLQYMVDNDISSPYKFSTMTCPLKEIPMRIDLECRTDMSLTESVKASLSLPVESSPIDFNPWRKVTDNFSSKAIIFYVRLYDSREEQMRLVERIELACTKDEVKHREEFFTKLRMYIRSGGFVNNSIGYSQILRDLVYCSTGEWSIDTEVKRLQKINQNLQQRLDEIQHTYEAEMKRIEAKYQAEIAELKQRYGETDEEAVIDEGTKKSQPEQLSLTITELSDYVKERFSKSGGDEASAMLYRLAVKHKCLDDETFKLIDDIVPAIWRREFRPTEVNIPSAGQVNINPQNVHNHFKDEEEES